MEINLIYFLIVLHTVSVRLTCCHPTP
jgi:hypothetical protein